jgi:hypothetical protein
MPAKRSPNELRSPLARIELTDQQWTDIKREGDLKDEFRPAIEVLFYHYELKRTADTKTRRKVSQLDDVMAKAARLIDDLFDDPVISRDYRYIGTVGQHGPDLDLLANARDTFAAVRQEIANANERFDTASQLLWVPEYGVLEDFIFGLLFIQARSREITPPISFAESTHNPKFHRYIELCIGLVEPTKTKSIDHHLEKALSAFNKFRTKNPDRWATNWHPALRQENK